MTYLKNNEESPSISSPGFHYYPNHIRDAILRNQPVESKLHMIICVSNPCNYARRYDLAEDFIRLIEQNHSRDVILYVVELAYNKQRFLVTRPDNPRHLQIRTKSPAIWAKEQLWNIGVKKLLPADWKAVAFCDADIEFDNPDFAVQTLKLLNGDYDVLQLFSHALDLNLHGDPMSIFTGFCYQITHRRPMYKSGIHFPHPGFNIAMTREAYQQLGRLYDYGVLGSGDHHFWMSMIQRSQESIHKDASEGYKKSLLQYERKCVGMRLGYVPGTIRHYFHGSKAKRYYMERWSILTEHQFDPYIHVKRNVDGLLIPTRKCPKKLISDVQNYFEMRDEDESVRQIIEIASKAI